MVKRLQVLILIAFMLVLPVRGMAAVAMSACSTAHTPMMDMPGHDHAAMMASQADIHAVADPDQTQQHDQKPHVGHLASHCSACAACCFGGVMGLAPHASLLSDFATYPAIGFTLTPYIGFHPENPERPPRA